HRCDEFAGYDVDEQIVTLETVRPLGRAAVEDGALPPGERDHRGGAVAVLLEAGGRDAALQLAHDRLHVPLVPHRLALPPPPLARPRRGQREDLGAERRAVLPRRARKPVPRHEVEPVALVADDLVLVAENVAVLEVRPGEDPMAGPIDHVAAGRARHDVAEAVIAAAGEGD